MLDESFSCHHSPKKFKLSFDGGLCGKCRLKLCNSCYASQDKKFVIKEEIINEKSE